jgi:hypothetical protein
MLGVTLFDSEQAMRKGDEAMNAGPGNAGSRSSVEFYEVPLHTLWGLLGGVFPNTSRGQASLLTTE